MSSKGLKRVVFSWDGSQSAIDQCSDLADRFESFDLVYAIKAMPHESIYSYSYCTPETAENRSHPQIQFLKKDFAERAKDTPLRRVPELRLLFGDRISEVAAFVNRKRADLLITTRMSQSAFSQWIHGDLNRWLENKVSCEVLFLEPKKSEALKPIRRFEFPGENQA